MEEEPEPRAADTPPPVHYHQYNLAMPGSYLNVLQRGSMLVDGAARTSSSAYDRLRAVSEAALDDSDIVAFRGEGSPIRLGQGAYVRRTVEPRLMSRLRKPVITALVGEAGNGKSVLLWRVHRRLRQEGCSPQLVPATSLLDDTAGPTLTVEAIGRALRECPADRPPVLLVDTLDLLLHDEKTRGTVGELLDMAGAAKVPTLVTSRPVEARLLRLGGAEADADGAAGDALAEHRIGKVTLYDYDERERNDAIGVYAASFYPPEKVAEVEDRIRNAMVRGLPLHEVCRSPLALRLLLELYAPDELPETDVDTIGLHDTYWQRRVVTDRRSSASAGSGADLTCHAHAAGLSLLSAGSIEAKRVDLVERTGPLSRGCAPSVETGIDLLHSRGVLRTPPNGGRLRFFHQTFFEHTAARAVLAFGEPVARELLNRVHEDPHDLFYGEVAAQFLLLTERRHVLWKLASHELREWLSSGERGLRVLAMRTYARMQRPREDVRAAAAHALETCESDIAVDYLRLLPSVHQESFERINTELGVLWSRAEHMRTSGETAREGRSIALNLIEALSRLAASHPRQVLRFVEEHACMQWLEEVSPTEWHNQVGRYLRLLGSLYSHYPKRCAPALIDFFERFSEDGKPEGMAEILDILNDRPDIPVDADLVVRIETCLRGFESDVSAEPMELAYVRLRRRYLVGLTNDDLLRRTSEILGAPDRRLIGRRAELRSLVDAALDLGDADARDFLDVLLREEHQVRQEDLLTVLGGALDQDEPGPPLAVYARRRCRDALASLPATRHPDGSRPLPLLFVSALYGGRVTGARLLSSLPETTSRELWLDPDGLMPLLTPAALAGHPAAVEVLDSLPSAAFADPKKGKAAGKAVRGRLREAAKAGDGEALGHLLAHAEASRDVADLCDIIRHLGADDLGVLAVQWPRLRRLRQDLLASADGNDRTQGNVLARLLVEHRVEPYPEPARIAADLARPTHRRLLMSLLGLVDACLRGEVWTDADTTELLDALTPYMGGSVEERAGAVAATARRLVIGLHARHTPLPSRPDLLGAFVRTVMELVYEAGFDLDRAADLDAFTRCLAEAARLPDRLSDHGAVRELVLEVARRNHRLQPDETRWRRDAAQAWHRAIVDSVARSTEGGLESLIEELLANDRQMARLAVAACVDRVRPLPAWLPELAQTMPPEVHKRMRAAMTRIAREGGSSALPALYEAAIGVAAPT